MDNNYPLNANTQPSGLGYLWTYSGGLKLLELIICVTVISSLVLAGFLTNGYYLCGLAILAICCTTTLIALHIFGVVRRSKWPWHWIECIYVLTVAILFSVCSTVTMSAFTKGYIITGIIGYTLTMVYFFDTFDKYQQAVAPVPKYAWTRPNMPDLE